MCSTAVLLGGLGQAVGSTESNTQIAPMSINPDEVLHPNTFQSKWLAIDNGDDNQTCSGVCMPYSLLISAAIAKDPSQHIVTVTEKDVTNLLGQHVDNLKKCLPILNAVVADTFKVNADFLVRYAETTWFSVKYCGKGDYPCDSGELNEAYMNDLYEGHPESIVMFWSLVEMFYGQKVEDDGAREELKERTQDFLALRKALFDIWARVMYTEIAKIAGKECPDVAFCMTCVGRFPEYVENWGTRYRLPDDLSIIDLAACVHRTEELYKLYWDETLGVDKSYGRQWQEEALKRYVADASQMRSGVDESEVFLFGLTTSPYWDGKLWEQCALRIYGTESLECGGTYFKKSFFDGDGKKALNILYVPATVEYSDQNKWSVEGKHAVSLIPSTDNTPYWVVQQYDLSSGTELIRSKLKGLDGCLNALSGQISSGKKRKIKRELDSIKTFWANKRAELIVYYTIFIPRIFTSVLPPEQDDLRNIGPGEKLVEVTEVSLGSEQWRNLNGHLQGCNQYSSEKAGPMPWKGRMESGKMRWFSKVKTWGDLFGKMMDEKIKKCENAIKGE